MKMAKKVFPIFKSLMQRAKLHNGNINTNQSVNSNRSLAFFYVLESPLNQPVAPVLSDWGSFSDLINRRNTRKTAKA